jgi:hypothetical protein
MIANSIFGSSSLTSAAACKKSSTGVSSASAVFTTTTEASWCSPTARRFWPESNTLLRLRRSTP